MWVNKSKLDALQEAMNRAVQMQMESYLKLGGALGEVKRLELENTRMRADLDWFKLRLNHVELERAQLISAAIGVKVTVPQFLPAQEKVGEALNEMPDLSSIGGDAVEEGEPLIPGEGANGVDYTMMPGYRKNR